jgi:2-polyprenyl-3-methyl-5-hydroxy-6-metoxy-1,4-benzoquinol methylase
LTGIDSSFDAIDYTAFMHRIEGVRFIAANVSKSGFANGSIDVLTSFETIEHIRDTESILGKFLRRLRLASRLIISAPNDRGFTNFIAIRGLLLSSWMRRTFE